MKKICFLIIFSIVLLFNISNASEINLIDVENHWAKENINRMVINKKINGYPDGSFKPNNEVTTLEFIKIILNTLDVDLVRDGLKEWPDYYIATAQKYNLGNDYYKKLTRYEAVEIISKLIDLKDVSTSNNKFKDLDSKHKSNVLKLAKLKIINGYEDKTFRGNNTITRAEAVTIAIRSADAKKEIVKDKKYSINDKYTNVGFESNSKGAIDKIRYEIKNGKIFFRDEGRFSDLIDYTIDEKYVTNKKLIKIIESLISEDSYTAVYYVPSKYIINQIIIRFGEDDNYISRGLDYFSFTYYEDKLYDLKRITLKDNFSNECYLKIDVKKLWKELYKLQNKDFIDESIKLKLLESLKVEFGKDADRILEYILERYIKDMNKEYDGEVIVEQTKINNYIINFYKTDATSLEFYFEKLSS